MAAHAKEPNFCGSLDLRAGPGEQKLGVASKLELVSRRAESCHPSISRNGVVGQRR
jgi:hypothetical protein